MAEYRPPWKGLGVLPHNLQPGEELIVEAVSRRY